MTTSIYKLEMYLIFNTSIVKVHLHLLKEMLKTTGIKRFECCAILSHPGTGFNHYFRIIRKEVKSIQFFKVVNLRGSILTANL